MPTSYTSLLGLALPVTGELSGTWGDTVNNFITQYVDAAVAGAQTISGSQTAVTLSTTTNASLSQAGAGATGSAQYQIINCTGNPASALTVTVPSASKAYLVLNNTSTNQTVTVKGAATTGVTVAAARCALIAWNGTDFELVATDDASKMNGVLAAVNGGTGQSSYAVGDILYASTTTALSKLADVATGNALISGGVGVAPSYGKIGLTTHVSGTLPIANGGTNGTATPTAGTIAYGTGSAYAFNSAGTSGQVLTSAGAGVPTWTTATNANTASAIVQRDASGNFSAGTITATLSGSATQVSNNLTLATSGTGLSGSATFNGSSAQTFTVTSNATSANTASAIVARDASGNFSAGTITATLSGNATNVSGTVAVANGGTGLTAAPTNGQVDIGSTGVGFVRTTLTAGSGVSITNGAGSITISATGSGGTVTGVTATAPVASSGGTAPVISLNSAYGDTLNPYGSKTANFFLAAPNGAAGAPTFRAIVAADIPTLNQNTTGTAANVTGTVAVANGGTGATTAPNARTNLGATTVGSNFFTLTNPTAVTFPRINADNTVSALDAATFRSAIGAGTGSGTVTSVGGTGTVNGLTLSGTVTSSGSLTLSGAISGVPNSATTATNLNTASAIVARDASGNFSAGTITATLSGNATNVSGTVAVANGGTGATTLTANNVLLGNGTSALQVVAPGSNGNVLTSNGTTWVSSAPAAAGGSITATASGSITAGNPVVINSNGTVSAISGSPNNVVISTTASPQLYNGGNLFSPINGDVNTRTVAWTYDASIDRCVGVYINYNQGQGITRPSAIIGTPLPDGQSYGFTTQIVSSTNVGTSTMVAVGTDGAGGFMYVCSDGSGNLTYSLGAYNSTNNTISWTAFAALPSMSTVETGIVNVQYMPGPARWVVITQDDAAGTNTGVAYGVFATSYQSFGTFVSYSSRGTYTGAAGSKPFGRYGVNGCWVATNNASTVVALVNMGNVSYICPFNVNASSINAGSASVFLGGGGTPNDRYPAIVFNASTSSFIVCYYDFNATTGVYVNAFTVASSGTPTITGPGTRVLVTSILTVGNDNIGKAAFYSPSGRCAGFILWATSDNQNSGAPLGAITVTSSGSTATLCASGYQRILPQAIYSGYWGGISTPSLARGAFSLLSYLDGNFLPTLSGTLVNFSGNLTATNFIGFSAGTYSNGATATITTVGGTNTSQSGLTTGRASYVNGNGVLGVGPSVPAAYGGIPLSATSILVKG